jgi:hypothetical protein
MAQDGVQWSDLVLAVSVPERKEIRQWELRSDWVVHSKLGRSVYAKNIKDQDVLDIQRTVRRDIFL